MFIKKNFKLYNTFFFYSFSVLKYSLYHLNECNKKLCKNEVSEKTFCIAKLYYKRIWMLHLSAWVK